MNTFISRTMQFLLSVTLVFGTFAVVACAQEMEKKMDKKDTMEKKDGAMDKKDGEMMKKDGEMMKKDGEMMKKDAELPVVAVIRADWCPYCKKLEPIMSDLMKEYEGKLKFVVFDITNEETTAKSMELAKAEGLEDFFKDNKDKSAFVAIIKNGKQTFNSKYKTERKVYVKEFDKALEK